MAKLLMITGIGSAKDLASGRRGAFYNTLEEFHKYWERVDIISPKIKGLESGVRNLFDNVFIHISPWPLVFHPFWFLKKGLEIYKEQKFDLMTVHEFPPFYNGIGARLLWQKIKVPYVLEIHHVPGHPKAANLKEGIYRSLMKWFIKFDASKATVVRVVNQNQTPEFLKRAGVPEKKITYMPSMYIDLETFKPMNMKKEHDLIFVGRLEPNKGIGLLLEAASKLKVKSEKLKVLIVGDGPLTKSLKLRVKSLKLENNIIFYGRAKDSSEIAQLLNKSKILVMPSYNEGGPRVVLEAMACEVPVLVTSVGIVPDLFKNLSTGHAYRQAGRQVAQGGEIIAWEPEDIANKAFELLNNSERYREYSVSGLEIAKQFERKAVIKNYAEKLKNIIS